MITSITSFAAKATDELRECVLGINENEAQRFYADILNARRVFAWSAGRCNSILRCFILRIMHLGYKTNFVGDTTTPAIGPGDVLVIATAAGDNIGIASIAERARGFGAKVILLTMLKDSLCARNSDYTVIIPGHSNAQGGIGISIQPGGAKFEQSMLIFLDAVLAKLMEDIRLDGWKSFELHANLE